MARKRFEVPYNPYTGEMFDSVRKLRDATASGFTYVGYAPKPDGSYGAVVPDWRLNIPFPALMKIVGVYQNATLEDGNGYKFNMFPTELNEVIEQCIIDKGRVYGTWVVRKRSGCYGIGLAKPDDF